MPCITASCSTSQAAAPCSITWASCGATASASRKSTRRTTACSRRTRFRRGSSVGWRVPPPAEASSRRFRLQVEGGRVEAIAQAGRFGPVLEDMAEMGVAAAAQHLDPPHEQAAVVLGGDAVLGHRRPEARPAGAGIELGVGAEELLAAAHAGIGAGRLGVPIGAAEGALGALLARDAVLLGCELGAPLGVAFDHLVLAGHSRLPGAWPSYRARVGAQAGTPPLRQGASPAYVAGATQGSPWPKPARSDAIAATSAARWTAPRSITRSRTPRATHRSRTSTAASPPSRRRTPSSGASG